MEGVLEELQLHSQGHEASTRSGQDKRQSGLHNLVQQSFNCSSERRRVTDCAMKLAPW
jgi:hypothetical protein